MAVEGSAKDIRHHLQLVTKVGMNIGYTAVGALPGTEFTRTLPIYRSDPDGCFLFVSSKCS